jgi:hypothetical protein
MPRWVHLKSSMTLINHIWHGIVGKDSIAYIVSCICILSVLLFPYQCPQAPLVTEMIVLLAPHIANPPLLSVPASPFTDFLPIAVRMNWLRRVRCATPKNQTSLFLTQLITQIHNDLRPHGPPPYSCSALWPPTKGRIDS